MNIDFLYKTRKEAKYPNKKQGSGALPGKMLRVKIIENNKIDAYLGQVRLNKVQLCPTG